MLFFQGFGVVLYHFFNGTQVLVDGWGSVLNFCFDGRCLRNRFDYGRGRCRCFFGFFLQTLGFTLATTHFTWVVRRTAVFGEGAGRGFNHWGGHFGNHWGFHDHRSRLGNHNRFCNHRRFGDNHFSSRCWSFFYRCRGRGFGDDGWLGSPLEGGLFFANFTHSRGSFFDHRSFYSRFDYWLRLNRWSWFNGNHVGFWLCIANRGNFHFRNRWGFDRGRGFNDWRFNNRRFNRWGFGGWRFYGNSVFDGSGSAFGLLVSLGFSRCADD